MNYFIFDVETTGLPKNDNYDDARIIEIAWQVVDHNFYTLSKFNCLLQLQEGVDIKNSHIHSITNQQCAENGISFDEMIQQLKHDLYKCNTIVAHNLNFDYHVLLAEFYRRQIDATLVAYFLSLKTICTMAAFTLRLNLKNLKSPKLSELYYYCFQKPLPQAHRAEFDVENLRLCLVKLKQLKKQEQEENKLLLNLQS